MAKFSLSRRNVLRRRRLFLESLERRDLLASVGIEGAYGSVTEGSEGMIRFSRTVDEELGEGPDSVTITFSVTPYEATGYDPIEGTADISLVSGSAVIPANEMSVDVPFLGLTDIWLEPVEWFRVQTTSATSSNSAITYEIPTGYNDVLRQVYDSFTSSLVADLDRALVCGCRCDCPGVSMRTFVASGIATATTYFGFLKFDSSAVSRMVYAGIDQFFSSSTATADKIQTAAISKGEKDTEWEDVGGPSVFYDPETFIEDEPLRLASPISIGDERPSGRYGWSYHVLEHRPNIPAVIHNFHSYHIYKNYRQNEFGGWIHTDIDRLRIYDYNDPIEHPNEDGVVWFRGDSNAFWFSEGPYGYERESGELDYSTLVKETDGTYTLTKQKGDVLRFNSIGVLTTRTDRNGNVTAYAYIDADEDGKSDEIFEITYPGGLTYEFGYTGHFVTTITDPYGRVSDLANNGVLSSITLPDPDGAGSQPRPVISFGYSDGKLTSYTEPEGNTTTITYVDGMVRTVTHADGGVETIHATLATGLHIASDGLGTEEDPRPFTKTVDVIGTYENEVDAVWYYRHDRWGTALWIQNPLGGITEFEVSTEYLVTKRTDPDPDGAGGEPRPVTTYSWSTRNLTGISLPDGSSRSWSYGVFAQVASYTNGRGYVTNITLDATNGNATAVSIPSLTITANYSYTNTCIRGLVSQVTDPLGRVTSVSYDGHGHVTSIVYAAGTADQISEHFGYDSTDNLAWSYDALGRRTDYDYDLLDRLIEMILPDPDLAGPLAAPIYLYDYNKNNYIRKVTDPLGRITEYDYSSRNDVVEVKQPDPDGAGSAGIPTTEYEYDLHRRLTDITDPLGRVTTLDYDLLDRQTDLVLPDPDGGGSQTSPEYAWDYDPISRTTLATDPLDNSVAYAYGNLWREITATLPDSSEVETIYDAEGNLVTSIDELGRETTFAYDALNRLSSVTLPDPDGEGELDAPVTTYQYDKASNLRFVIDPLGNTTEYVYDNLNRLVTVLEADPDGGGSLAKPQWTYQYDAAGNLVRQIDPLGRETAYEYDRLDRLVAVKQADGSLPSAAVTTTTQGGPVNEVQRVGFANSYYFYAGTFTLTFDGQTTGNIAYNASAATVQTALESLSNIGFGDVVVTKITDTQSSKQYSVEFQGALAGTNVAQITVDGSNLQAQTGLTETEATDTQGTTSNEVQTATLDDTTGGTFTLGFGGLVTSSLDYDATAAEIETALELLANIDDVSVSGSPGGPWAITFQGAHAGLDMGLLVIDGASLIGPDPTSATRFTYDAANNLLTVTDPLGYVTEYEYDNLDRLISTTLPDPDGGGGLSAPVTTYTYDAVSNLLTLTDPVGNTTTWVYDNLDRVTAETNELDKTRSFKYDAVGNLTERIDRLGRKTVWEYDNLYRNTNEKWYDGSTLVRTLSFSYLADGSLASASDAAAIYSFGYDGLGRVTNEGQTLTGLTPEMIYESQFDTASRRTQLQAEIGGTDDFKNTYTYDNLHRLTRLQQQDVTGGNVVADKRIDFAYNAASQFEKISRYADQSATEFVANTFFSYDGMGRLAKLLHTEDASAPGSGWGTEPLAGYEFTYDAASRIASINSYVDGLTEYDYDNTDQLTGADHTGQTDETYAYDENGNRTNSGYSTTDNNQLTTDGVYNYTYDDEGNRLTKTKISTGEKEEYTWDHRNRLTAVTFKNSSGTVLKTVLHTYDAFNRWIRRSVDADGPGSGAAVDTFFSWEANQVNLQFDTEGDLTHRYLWQPAAIDQILADESVSSLSSAGEVLWPLTDHLGTPRDIASYDSGTDEATIENHRVFNSFGALTSETNASVTTLVGFTGVLFDSSTSLNYHRARWLDLRTGRWMSEDPIAFGGRDTNLMRYVGNAPTRFKDSTGLEGEGHHGTPKSTWEETGFDASVFKIWDADDAKVYQPEGTGHNFTAHGAKNGYVAHVQALLREELAAFISKHGECGKLTVSQQEEFARQFKAKIQSMPEDSFIGGFNAAVKRGGVDEVKKWWNTTGSKIKPPIPSKPVSIAGTLKAAGGAAQSAVGKVSKAANAVGNVQMAHEALIAAQTPGHTCRYETYYFKDAHGTYHYEQKGDVIGPYTYRGTDAVYDSGAKKGERVKVFWFWSNLKVLMKEFIDPPKFNPWDPKDPWYQT